MTLQEIKQAVLNGLTVCVSNAAYTVSVVKGNWYITCSINNHTIGLTWLDGETLNSDATNFYIKAK